MSSGLFITTVHYQIISVCPQQIAYNYELRTQNSELRNLFNIILEDCNKFDE